MSDDGNSDHVLNPGDNDAGGGTTPARTETRATTPSPRPGGTLGSSNCLTAADNAAPAAALPPARPGSGNILFSDNPIFSRAYEDVREELLYVYAPAGKLGVVIDTPDDNTRVVHAVKDTSSVADLVRVGDKLVAVDDEDVRVMTAIKVSKLISQKDSNSGQKLTLIWHVSIRGRGRAGARRRVYILRVVC